MERIVWQRLNINAKKTTGTLSEGAEGRLPLWRGNVNDNNF